MSLQLVPDVEQILSAYLRSRTEVTDLVGQRVYTEIPADPTWPLVRLTQIDEQPIQSDPLYFVASRIQIDTFAWTKAETRALDMGPKRATYLISETVRQVLRQAPQHDHADAVITAVRFLTGPQYRPDGTFDPARPRRLFDINVYVHAA